MRRRARKESKRTEAAEDEEDEEQNLIGMKVVTKAGRIGKVIAHDPTDALLEIFVRLLRRGRLVWIFARCMLRQGMP